MIQIDESLFQHKPKVKINNTKTTNFQRQKYYLSNHYNIKIIIINIIIIYNIALDKKFFKHACEYQNVYMLNYSLLMIFMQSVALHPSFKKSLTK